MPRTTDNDLSPGSINLLPDEMRSAEDKDRRSKSNESPYQLRAPKREKKRRRVFAWLPFFGGEHWEASAGEPTGKAPAPHPAGDAVRVSWPEIPKPQHETVTPEPRITPIVPIRDERPGSVSPKAHKAFKTGFSFPGLSGIFGGVKRTTAPVPHQQAQQKAQSDFPARHYSLLEDTKPAITSPVPQPAPTEPVVPFIASTGERQSHVVTMASVETPKPTRVKHSAGIRWPKWLDIFYLIGIMTTPASGKPRVSTLAPKQTTSAAVRQAEAKHAQPIVLVKPMPQPKPVKPRRNWFAFLSWFTGKPRTAPRLTVMPAIRPSVPVRPVTPPPAPPRPASVPPPVAPAVSEKPVLPVTPTMSVTPVIPEITPTVTSAPAPVAVPVPTSPVAFTPAQPKVSPITPIVETETGKKKSLDALAAKLHIPKKFDIIELAKSLQNVNLIPGEMTLRSWRTIVQSIALTIIGVGVLTGVSYALLNMWETQVKNRTAEIDTEINKFKNDILFYQKQEPVMTAIGTRVELIKQILGKHIYWTKFFSLLEKYTLADVYYDGISATPTGKLSLSAHGSSFETVTRALRLLSSAEAKEFVSAVAITGAHRADTESGQRVDFVIELTLNPDLFYYQDGQE